MRTCAYCGETKPLQKFATDSRCLGGRRPTCHLCYNEKKKNSASYKKRLLVGHNRRAALKRRYGISPKLWDALLEDQNSMCAICGAKHAWDDGRRLCVDHCHKSGQIRGLICGPCNRALGMMQDDPGRLRAAASYLEAAGEQNNEDNSAL